jgi:hypothetical protein
VRRTSGKDFGSWPTPCTQDGPNGGPGQGSDRLPGAAALASWGTPTNNEAGGTPEQFLARKQALNGACGVSLTALNLQAQLASWPTPKVTDTNGPGNSANRQGGMALHTTAQQSVPVRLTATGELLTGSSARMESGGQLNPAHSRWLMGLPPEWDACAPTATASALKRQRRG